MTDKKKAFDEVKKSICEALEEIKKNSPELYEHLTQYIIMDEKSKSFTYAPP